MREKPRALAPHFQGGSRWRWDSRAPRSPPVAPPGAAASSEPPRMRISHFLAGGLVLALLSSGLEARPASRPQQKPARRAPGHELAEAPAAGSERGEAAGGGRGSRLLRELRVDTKSRAAWARLLRDYPSTRRHKGVSKKGLSKGCFGLKLDRIGSMSGLGC